MSWEKSKVPSFDSSLCSFDIMGDDDRVHMYFPTLLLATFDNEADGREGYNIWINLSHLEDDGEIDHYCYLTLNVDELVTPKNAAYVNPVYCNFTDQLLQTGIAEDTGIRKKVDEITYHLWVFKQEFLEDLHDINYHKYSKRYDECIDSMNLNPSETEDQGMNFN